jgi:hypothetical protein
MSISLNNSKDQIINQSQTSINNDNFLKNEEFLSFNLDKAYKDLNSQIFNIVNTVFDSINANYEDNLEKHQKIHDCAITKLTEEITNLEKECEEKIRINDIWEEKILIKINNFQNKLNKKKIFGIIKENYVDNKDLYNKEHRIVNCYFRKNYLRKIYSAWKFISKGKSRSYLNAKYAEMYNKEYEEIYKSHNEELQKYTQILIDLENQIQKEVDERGKLSALYDEAMSKAAGSFMNETSKFKKISTSNIQVSKENLNKEKKSNVIIY